MTHPPTHASGSVAAATEPDTATPTGVDTGPRRNPDPATSPSAPPLGRRVDPTTAHLATLSDRVVKAASAHGARVASAGVHPIPSGMEFRRVDAADWLLCPVADDPILHRRGRMPMPGHVGDNLRRLMNGGMDFPTVVIAHQLGPSPTAPNAASVMAASGRPATAQEAAARLGEPPPHPTAVQHAEGVDRIASSMTRAVASTGRITAGALCAVIAAPFALIALDPIILGAVTAWGAPHRPGVPAAWFELGRWDW